jgi:hypothetical protein
LSTGSGGNIRDTKPNTQNTHIGGGAETKAGTPRAGTRAKADRGVRDRQKAGAKARGAIYKAAAETGAETKTGGQKQRQGQKRQGGKQGQGQKIKKKKSNLYQKTFSL